MLKPGWGTFFLPRPWAYGGHHSGAIRTIDVSRLRVSTHLTRAPSPSAAPDQRFLRPYVAHGPMFPTPEFTAQGHVCACWFICATDLPAVNILSNFSLPS